MMVAQECRLGGPRDCIGHILPTLPVALSCQMAPYRQHKVFIVSESSALAFNIFLAGFLSFLFCLPLFFAKKLFLTFLLPLLCSSSISACFTGVSVSISDFLFPLVLLLENGRIPPKGINA
ncbi:hypothetical protein CRENBAI_009919 [Crenichthys baileyi]|uniref:Uncharacterized protein n=1 Tax=Crenichthys baileyi TaxID=28760 RepID=A0AAV9SK16_9TELE